MEKIEKILREYPFIVIDGGLATELERKGYNLNDRLWSAKIIAEDPEAIADVHLSYLLAGADCIITSSYQATVPGFMSAGYSRKEAVRLIEKSVFIARDALKKYNDFPEKNSNRPEPFFAASAGCYGAYLANGSEYRGDYHLDSNGYKSFHRERVEILAAAGADIIAFETFPSMEEAVSVAELMDEYSDLSYWIVFTIKDSISTVHGDSVGDCIKYLLGKSNLIAAGINCSPPEYVAPALEILGPSVKKKIIVYPNSGEHFYTDCSCWRDDPSASDFYQLAGEWFSRGAVFIGGCCRTGPSEVAKIRLYRDELADRTVRPVI